MEIAELVIAVIGDVNRHLADFVNYLMAKYVKNVWVGRELSGKRALVLSCIN